MRWVEVQEIYADGKHNSWPDICRWRDRYYVTFNCGGKGHSNGHGVCVLSSTDARRWEKVIETPAEQWIPSSNHQRVLCPKLLPTEDRLIVMYYLDYYEPGDSDIAPAQRNDLKQQWSKLGGSEKSFERWIVHHETSFRSALRYTEDGCTFSAPQTMLAPSWRVWRPHTFDGRHYVVGYRCHGQSWSISRELESMIPRADSVEMFESASLFGSRDGLSWEKISEIGVDDNDEPDFDFAPDGRMLVVSRTGSGCKHAIAYVGDPPYKSWRRLPLAEMIHSPAVRNVGGRWIVCGRYEDEATKRPHPKFPNAFEGRYGTRLWFLDEKTGELTQAATLPSWGDCAYPGMVQTPEGDLLVVYYATSHTVDVNLIMGPSWYPCKYAPASIYLARVTVDE